MLERADGDATGEIDQGDDDPRDRFATDKPAGPIHRGEKVAAALQFVAETTCVGGGERACLQFGIDRHLAAGHRVERETGCHFTRATGAGGDHDQLHDGDDREYHGANGEAVARDKSAKRLHHLPCRGFPIHRRAGQDQTCRGDVEHQPNQRCSEEKRGEDRHLEGGAGGDRSQKRDHGGGQVCGKQQVDHRRGQRDHHRHHGHEEGQWDCGIGEIGCDGSRGDGR